MIIEKRLVLVATWKGNTAVIAKAADDHRCYGDQNRKMGVAQVEDVQ